MTRVQKHIRIGPLIFAILVFVLASTNGAIMYTSYSSAREQLREEMHRSFAQSQTSALSAFWDELSFLSSTIELVARDKDLGLHANNGRWVDAENYLYDALLGVSDRLDILLILDAEGREVGNAGNVIDNTDTIAQQVKPYIHAQEWVTVGKEEQSLIRAVPIIYQNSGQVVGHLVFGMSLWSNIRFANDIRRVTGRNRVELFVEDRFQVSSPIVRQSKLAERGNVLSSYAKQTVLELGEHQVAFVAPIELSESAVVDVVFLADDTAFEGLVASFQKSLTIQVGVVLAGSALVLLLLMWLVVTPAKKMSKYAMSIVGDEDSVTFEPSFIAEFNTMGKVVDGVFKDLQRTNADLTDLKNSLQQQVEQRTANLQAEVEMRRKAETELRKLALAVEQSPAMIFITDLEGKIEYVNARFCELTGYSPAESIGHGASLIKSSSTPREIHEELWTTILSGQEWHSEIRDRKKDGSHFWANASIAPVQGSSGQMTHFIAMHEDISERKQAEEQMRDAKRTAEIANRAKTELMANMSHELRTPLNAILGFSSTMQEAVFGPLGDEKYEEYVTYIHNSGAHLLELINDILDVSAIESGKLELHEETVDIASICEACQQIIHPRAKESGVELLWPQCINFPPLKVDARRMKQILLNLLSNAVKFTPRGGRVVCDAQVNEGGVTIAVEDTGIGMSDDGIAKAMMEFGQVDSSLSRKHEGTGLGLPLTKSLVELHGGTFVIHSEESVGTKVTITLPLNRILETETLKAAN